MKTLGVIVNPVAGLGGRVGLKGTDGAKVLREARRLGAQPEASARTIEALQPLAALRERIAVITSPAEMGEDACRAVGLAPLVLGTIERGATTAADTRRAAREMVHAKVSLLLFAGGDGTARDVHDAVGPSLCVLGIPAGVKIHSAVFAVTPRHAGDVAARFLADQLLKLRDGEVMDIDEAAFRDGRVSARLYGYLRVPDETRFVQRAKAGGLSSDAAGLRGIAADVIEAIDASDDCFLIGPGTTTRAITDALALDGSLLGVDVVHRRRLVARDVAERELLEVVAEHPAVIVVTPIGGQGHLFGRGNQQFSPAVIRAVGRQRIIVVATRQKLASLAGQPLLLDTGDEALNDCLSGYLRVTTGFHDYVMAKVGHQVCA